jgi:XTP/dITP diphosphohydrolase
MTRLLVATTNLHKLGEIKGLLADLPVEIIGLDAFAPLPEPEETGDTFAANARLKALYYENQTGFDFPDEGPPKIEPGLVFTVAEDSGLVIDALDGEPGVRSARFLRSDASYPERFQEIFRRLDARPDRPRTAHFVCALSAARRGRIVFETEGRIDGEIARQPRGSAGFGYDPIFFYPPYGQTLAEVTEDAKLRVAHRGQAFRSFAAWLTDEV